MQPRPRLRRPSNAASASTARRRIAGLSSHAVRARRAASPGRRRAERGDRGLAHERVGVRRRRASRARRPRARVGARMLTERERGGLGDPRVVVAEQREQRCVRRRAAESRRDLGGAPPHARVGIDGGGAPCRRAPRTRRVRTSAASATARTRASSSCVAARERRRRSPSRTARRDSSVRGDGTGESLQGPVPAADAIATGRRRRADAGRPTRDRRGGRCRWTGRHRPRRSRHSGVSAHCSGHATGIQRACDVSQRADEHDESSHRSGASGAQRGQRDQRRDLRTVRTGCAAGAGRSRRDCRAGRCPGVALCWAMDTVLAP